MPGKRAAEHCVSNLVLSFRRAKLMTSEQRHCCMCSRWCMHAVLQPGYLDVPGTRTAASHHGASRSDRAGCQAQEGPVLRGTPRRWGRTNTGPQKVEVDSSVRGAPQVRGLTTIKPSGLMQSSIQAPCKQQRTTAVHAPALLKADTTSNATTSSHAPAAAPLPGSGDAATDAGRVRH